MPHAPSEPAIAMTGAGYTETLRVPWWFWPFAIAAAVFVPTEVFLGAYPALTWSVAGLLIVVVLGWLIRVDRLRIRVDEPGEDAELRVDDAHIAVSYISGVAILNAAAKRELLGPLGEANAFIIQRPWIREALRIEIDDPDDPTPCWLISTRHPRALAEAILAARR